MLPTRQHAASVVGHLHRQTTVSIVPEGGFGLGVRRLLQPTFAFAAPLLPQGLPGSASPRKYGRQEQRVSRPTAGQEPPPERAGAESDRRDAPRIKPYNRLLYAELCRPADAVIALLVFGTVFVLDNADAMPGGVNDFLLLRLSLGNLLTLVVFGYVWQLLFFLFGLYDSSEPRSLRTDAPSVAAACTLGALVGLIPVAWSESGAYNPHVVLIAWPLTVLATLGVRAVIRQLSQRALSQEVQRVVIVGTGPLATRLYDRVQNDPTSSYEVLGFVDTNEGQLPPAIQNRLLGSLDQLEPILMQTVVDEVLIALPIKSRYTQIQRALEECERAGVQSRYSPELFNSRVARLRLETPDGQPAIAMKVVNDGYGLVVKRAIDIVGATLGLIILSPLFAVIAIAIKVTSEGPVFFGQERYGWRKRRFTMHKFRTMVSGAEALQESLEDRNEAVGPVFKIADDPRVTPLGRFLRKSSLDELPQLWNVLRGEMSLVGPRPLPLRDVNKFEAAWLMRRFSVAPGITGLWQVSGRSDLPFHDWVRLDLEYIDRWSLALDLGILARTLPAVLRGTGAR